MMYHLYAAAQVLAAPAAPSPAPDNPNPQINTSPVLEFLMQWIAPVILSGLGILVMSRAREGRISQVMTTVAIALLGIAILGGAGTLVFIGDDLVRLVVK